MHTYLTLMLLVMLVMLGGGGDWVRIVAAYLFDSG